MFEQLTFNALPMHCAYKRGKGGQLTTALIVFLTLVTAPAYAGPKSIHCSFPEGMIATSSPQWATYIKTSRETYALQLSNGEHGTEFKVLSDTEVALTFAWAAGGAFRVVSIDWAETGTSKIFEASTWGNPVTARGRCKKLS
ncbi:MAG: hypothetical protein KI788_14095 [Mameliella sp.]|nr:hypothetical protein [Mameliella sp.]